MHPRIPSPIRPTLQEYLAAMDQQIPGLLNAFYVEGSIALGGFNERFSDIDFVGILDHYPNANELAALQNIHKAIGKNYPQWQVSGSYIQQNELSNSKVDAIICFEGKLTPRGRFDWNWVDGWTVKNHGIAVIGPEAQALPVNGDWDRLIESMRENLNTYWAGWTVRPYCLSAMMLDRGIQWAVLGVLRQYFTFRENTITTKVKAGEYALDHVPSRWHSLIKEAIQIREGKKTSVFPVRILRMTEAVRFLKFIIQACNADAEVI